MSLLDKGNADVLVYLQEEVRDRDGNIKTRARKDPIKLRVWLAVQSQSGTSARRAEMDNEGFESEQLLRMRVPRGSDHIFIGAQSKVQIGDEMWSVFGNPLRYMANSRTAHVDYSLRRS